MTRNLPLILAAVALLADTRLPPRQQGTCLLIGSPWPGITVTAPGSSVPECMLLVGATVSNGPTGTYRLLNVPSASTPPVSVTGEVPAGSMDGINALFTVANAPLAGSEAITLNGQRLARGVDYTVNGATITFTAGSPQIPRAGDLLQADYRH